MLMLFIIYRSNSPVLVLWSIELFQVNTAQDLLYFVLWFAWYFQKQAQVTLWIQVLALWCGKVGVDSALHTESTCTWVQRNL